MATDKDILEEAKEEFNLAAEHEVENRDAWLDDVRFSRMGDQWPQSVKRQRQLEGRPCLTFNRMPSFIRQVVNDARQNKPAIKTHPIGDGSDPRTAEILQGLIRNIETASDADVAYDTAIEHAVSGGFGYIKVCVEYAADDTFDREIKIDRVANPLTVYGDPLSMSADSSDWNRAFITEQMDEEEFERKYPGAKTSSFDDDGASHADEWFGEELTRVAEYWTRDEVEGEILLLNNGLIVTAEDWQRQADFWQSLNIGVKNSRKIMTHKVTQRIITGAEVLETNKWAGRYIPIIPVYGDEVVIDGKRYFHSLVKHARSAQESYNYWRTSAVEKVALDTKAPWIGPRGAFNSDPNWMTSNTQNHAFLEYDGPTPPHRAQAGGVPAADVQMALQAQDDMKSIIGLYDASLGKQGNETSGRAIIARQRQGDTATFHFIDNLSRAIRHTGRILVDLIPHVYDQPRIVRVLGEDGTPTNVPINQQVQGVEHIYDLTTGKYDVTVSSGPSYDTRREEAAVQMNEMIRAFPPLMQIAGDLLVKNLDWPGADELAKRIQAKIPEAQGENPQAKQISQQAQQQQQMMKQKFNEAYGQSQQQIQDMQKQLQELTAQNQQLQIALKDKQNDLQLKDRELQIKAFQAETDRTKALGAGMVPNPVQY
jgi:hypothetical protein